MGKSVLIVDDEVNILELLKYNLEKEQYTVYTAQSGEEGLALIKGRKIDLAILDLMLPGIDGLDLLKYIRSRDDLAQMLVILLTAKTSEVDKVIGLELGADDYLSKPFGIHELQARLKALFRRAAKANDIDDPRPLAIGDIVIDQVTHQVKKNQVLVELAPKEFSLLVNFAQSPERVFTRDELLLKIWGIDFLGESRTVDVHIKNLRKKVERNPEDPEYIKTVRGVGYKMVRNQAE